MAIELELYCQVCGAPWPLNLMTMQGLDTQNFTSGKGCPMCSWGRIRPKERPIRAEIMQIAREQFGDDLETIALELHDMKEKELLNEII